MKKLILLLGSSAILSTSIIAQSEIDRIMKQSGVDISATETGDIAKTKKSQANIYNYEEVVYERLSKNEHENYGTVSDSKYDKGFAAENVNSSRKKQAQLAKKIQKEISKKAEKEKTTPRFAYGYCYSDEPIEIERLPVLAYFKCDLQPPFDKKTLAVTLTPDFYAEAVIGTPKYIQDGDDRIPIVSGAVLTKDRNSINLANVVNDRKIARLTVKGLYTTTSVATKYAQAYLKMKETAATQQDQTTLGTTGGTTTIATTNTKEIPISNYLAGVAIETVSSLTKAVGEAFIQELPYTFKIYGNNIYYVDLQMSGQSNLVGYGVNGSSGNNKGFVQKQPKFTLDGKSTIVEPSNIKVRELKK